MDKIIETTEEGFKVTDNDEMLKSVIMDIARNNTAFPDVVDVYKFTKDVKTNEKTKDGKRRVVQRKAMRIYFADGSWTDVIKSTEDNDDPIVALLYGIVKRLMGTPTEGGYVNGDGFMSKLKRYVAHARSEEKEAKEKEERIAKKIADDKKAHEEALERRKTSPSIGLRLKNLEDKFDRLMDVLSKGSVKSDKKMKQKKVAKKASLVQPRLRNGRFARH